MGKSDYSKDLYKQVQELLLKCDKLSLEVKTIEKTTTEKFKKQIKEIKEDYNKKIEKLNNRIVELENENEKLRKENAILREDNDRLKKIINNNSTNSSNPPSTDIKKNIPNNREKSSKKIGGQAGHKGYGLSKSSILEKIKNEEVEHQVINIGNPVGEYVSKYVVDIKVINIVKEFRFYKDSKGKYNIPKEFKVDVQYGTELKTLCAILNTEGLIAIDRLTTIIKNITHDGIKLSNASIVNFVKELGEKTTSTIDSITTKLLNSTLMYTDATTFRCDNKNMFVRNYSTKEYVLLVPSTAKSQKCINETNILNRYTGDLVHDHETIIYRYGNMHVECNVHISRYLKGDFENTKNRWAVFMRSFLNSLNEFKKKQEAQGITSISQERLDAYSSRYDEIIKLGFAENAKIKSKYFKQKELSLLNRLKKYKQNHLLFIYDFKYPFDNNLSERDIRNVKNKQKISGCFNNLEHAKCFYKIKSTFLTLKRTGKNIYDACKKLYENEPITI